MSINGVLEDLPLADVLQFIHLGQRTGTLYLWRDDETRAEIGFHEGRIVSAWRPEQRLLGETLVAQEVIARDVLDRALALRRADRGEAEEAFSLGQVLITRFDVPEAKIFGAIKAQIQETVFDLVDWRRGNFHFAIDELDPPDDFALAPGELFADYDLNTQMLLLEATRIFDERHRTESHPRGPEPAAGALDQQLNRAGLQRADGALLVDSQLAAAGREARVSTSAPEIVRCQVVSRDARVADALRASLDATLARVVTVHPREAGSRVPGETAAPVVVVDLRDDAVDLELIATLARTRPSAAVIAAVPSDAPVIVHAAIYDAGATGVVEAAPEAVASAVRNWVRVLGQPTAAPAAPVIDRGGYGRFRRVVFDVQSGLLSATMALNLMHVISESVERAVLFLVQQDRLVAVGAFGFSHDGRPLAELTRGLRLEPAPGGALRQVMDEAAPRVLDYDRADLPASFSAMLGRPSTGQVVIFPVLGAERPISVIYTDNGERNAPIEDVKILELATAQVGVAFENELLAQRGMSAFADAESGEFEPANRS
ncbi:MAG: DUF4388 domain-containing protein [Acidobacteriota bacterium]